MTTVFRWAGEPGLEDLLAAYHLATEAEKGAPVAAAADLPARYRAEVDAPAVAFAEDVVLVARADASPEGHHPACADDTAATPRPPAPASPTHRPPPTDTTAPTAQPTTHSTHITPDSPAPPLATAAPATQATTNPSPTQMSPATPAPPTDTTRPTAQPTTNPTRPDNPAPSAVPPVTRALAGCVVLTLRDGEVELKRLWVDPAHRGHGIAAALVRAALATAGDRPVRLSVWQWRTGARALYTRLGFADAEPWDTRPGLVCLRRPA